MMTFALIWLARGQEVPHNASNAEIEKEILKVDGERNLAMQKRDMATLDRLHADTFVFVNTKGKLLNKTEYMEEIGSGNLKFLTLEIDDYHFHIYGDTVIMSARASSVVEYHGQVNRRPRRFTSVYIKLQGQWRLVAHQATLIADE
jgi:hypothetical protein